MYVSNPIWKLLIL